MTSPSRLMVRSPSLKVPLLVMWYFGFASVGTARGARLGFLRFSRIGGSGAGEDMLRAEREVMLSLHKPVTAKANTSI
jgi:hypothetical protein